MFLEIGLIKFFKYHSPTHIAECVSEHIFLISKTKITRRQKAKETKKRIGKSNSVLCYCLWIWSVYFTFNLLDRVSDFLLVAHVNLMYLMCNDRNHLFFILQHRLKNTVSRLKVKKKIIKRHFCLCLFLLYMFIRCCRLVIIKTRAYDVECKITMNRKLYIRFRLKASVGVLWQKLFLKVLQNSQENICVGVSF